METQEFTESLKFILQQYGPALGGTGWSLHILPFWSNPGANQVGLKVLCYQKVGSMSSQVANFVRTNVIEEMVIGVVSGTGIESIGMVGGSGYAPVDQFATWAGKAQKMHGAARPDEGFIGGMQVAGARDGGDPVALYHAIKAGGKVLLEAVVRVEPITSGKRFLVHGVTSAGHSDFLQSRIMDLERMSDTKTYWVYQNGVTYENGEPVGRVAA